MTLTPEASNLWIEKLGGVGTAGVWFVTPDGREPPRDLSWQAVEAFFSANANVASVSLVLDNHPGLPASWRNVAGLKRRADAPSLPWCFLNGLVGELIGVPTAPTALRVSHLEFERWCAKATSKGLAHLWWIREARPGGRPRPPETPGDSTGASLAVDRRGPHHRTDSLSVGIDVGWLFGGESGAQVFVVEMLKELARRDEVSRLSLFSESGAVPATLVGVPKIEGVSWRDRRALATPYVDVMHRPYQPAADLDYRRYRRVGRCVALTVLDFIAYDNPAYHESAWSWRRHRAEFDQQICLADGIFAISADVAVRADEQYREQLHEPVRAMLLGTDHLVTTPMGDDVPLGATVAPLMGERFLLVLGNDFEHKNRDFAVRVFAEMCDRDYEGRLVLAGFHLDLGSSYEHELQGAADHIGRIVRLGQVTSVEKAWLLSRADVVLYPTSAEGFGLIPFEAAALGTPVAFVRFGPLKETLPGVDACEGWRVTPFADLTFRLLDNPASQVAQVRAVAAELTWAAHVDRLLDGYRRLLSADAAWRSRRPRLPSVAAQTYRQLEALGYRFRRKAARLARRGRETALTQRTS